LFGRPTCQARMDYRWVDLRRFRIVLPFRDGNHNPRIKMGTPTSTEFFCNYTLVSEVAEKRDTCLNLVHHHHHSAWELCLVFLRSSLDKTLLLPRTVLWVGRKRVSRITNRTPVVALIQIITIKPNAQNTMDVLIKEILLSFHIKHWIG
jgi:hypothetical protein